MSHKWKTVKNIFHVVYFVWYFLSHIVTFYWPQGGLILGSIQISPPVVGFIITAILHRIAYDLNLLFSYAALCICFDSVGWVHSSSWHSSQKDSPDPFSASGVCSSALMISHAELLVWWTLLSLPERLK